MKNIFAYNVTEDAENSLPDGRCFVTARADGSRRRDLEEVERRLAEARAAALPGSVRVLKTVIGLAALICGYACMLALKRVPPHRLFACAPVLTTAAVTGALLWVSLEIWGRRRRRAAKDREERALLEVKTARAQAARELGAPGDAREIDLIFYRYRVKNGKETVRAAGGMIPFINIPGYVFLEGDALSLTDCVTKFSLPLEEIAGIRTVKKRLMVPAWNKDTPYNKGIYKKYHMTVNNMGLLFFKPYHVLSLARYGETYEWFLAPYDLDAVLDELSKGFGGAYRVCVERPPIP